MPNSPVDTATPWLGGPIGHVGHSERDVAELVEQETRHLGFPSGPRPLRPFVLPERSYRELGEVAVRLLDVLRRTLFGAAPDTAGRLAALGADPAEYDLFLADQELEDRFCAPMSRPDVVIGPDGPRFIEFNVSAAVGGIVETQVVGAALQRVHGGADAPFHCEAPFTGLTRMFDGICGDRPRDRTVAVGGLLADATYDCASTRYFDLLTDHLRANGFTAEYFEPDRLADGVGLPGECRFRYGLRHFTVTDSRRLGVDLEPARAALEHGCLLVGTETGEVIANKKVLAWASEGRPWLSAADHALVEKYVPWTREVGDRSVRWRGADHDLGRLLLAHREELVLKRGHGQCGLQVLIGADTDEATWAAAVDAAMADGESVVQEYVRAVRGRQRLYDLAAGEAFDAVVVPVFSPYLFTGERTGCMVRYFPLRSDGSDGSDGSDSVGIIGCDGFGALLNTAASARS